MEADTNIPVPVVLKDAVCETESRKLLSMYSSNNNSNGKVPVFVKDIKPELEGRIPVPDNQLTDAWAKYKAFEDYKNNEVSPLPLSEFISEWSARLNSAVAAGCEYSDTVLAFKLMDRVNLDDDAVRQVLDRYRYLIQNVVKIKTILYISVVDPNSFFSDSDSDPQIIFFGFGYGFGFLD
jgi:hypothetical protein